MKQTGSFEVYGMLDWTWVVLQLSTALDLFRTFTDKGYLLSTFYQMRELCTHYRAFLQVESNANGIPGTLEVVLCILKYESLVKH